MPHRNRNAPVEKAPAEAAEEFERFLNLAAKSSERQHNLQWLTERATRYTDAVSGDVRQPKRLQHLALTIRVELSGMNKAIERGDVEAAAVHAFLVGANAAELEVWKDIATSEWLTVSEASEILAVRPDTISDYVAKGILRSNGGSGKGRRLVDPASVCRRLLDDLRSEPPS